MRRLKSWLVHLGHDAFVIIPLQALRYIRLALYPFDAIDLLDKHTALLQLSPSRIDVTAAVVEVPAAGVGALDVVGKPCEGVISSNAGVTRGFSLLGDSERHLAEGEARPVLRRNGEHNSPSIDIGVLTDARQVVHRCID